MQKPRTEPKRYTVTRCGEEWPNLTAAQAVKQVDFLRGVYGNPSCPETDIRIYDGETQASYNALAGLETEPQQ
jgi:hypothetical protein